MKINFFKQRSARRFHYTPRYHKDKSDTNNYELGSRIVKSRETLNTTDLVSQWEVVRKQSRKRSNRGISMRLLIIILVLVLISLYILDFDLSIFNSATS